MPPQWSAWATVRPARSLPPWPPIPAVPEWIHIIGSNGTARLEGGSLRSSFLDGREEVLADTSGSGQRC